MKTIILSLSSILLFLSSACEEVVELSLPEQASQIVVDGLIVNKADESYVKLYKTTPYFSDAATEAVNAATVVVTDNMGGTFSFMETIVGVYKCPDGFQGIPGRIYYLDIETGGNKITATSTMPDAVEIESLRLEHVKDNKAPLQKGYHLYGILTDDPGATNYFRAERYVNGLRQQKTASDLQVFDDLFFDGVSRVEGTLGFWSNSEDDDFQLKKGDVVSVKLFTLNKAAFDYYKALQESPGQGGLFGKNPANIPSNTVGALGLFQASAYTSPEPVVVSE